MYKVGFNDVMTDLLHVLTVSIGPFIQPTRHITDISPMKSSALIGCSIGSIITNFVNPSGNTLGNMLSCSMSFNPRYLDSPGTFSLDDEVKVIPEISITSELPVSPPVRVSAPGHIPNHSIGTIDEGLAV